MELFMRRTKLRPRRNVERLKIISGTNVDLHMRRTKVMNLKKNEDNVYLASFGRKFFEIQSMELLSLDKLLIPGANLRD